MDENAQNLFFQRINTVGRTQPSQPQHEFYANLIRHLLFQHLSRALSANKNHIRIPRLKELHFISNIFHGLNKLFGEG